MNLRLLSVSFEHVELEAIVGDEIRTVSVDVGSGRSWLAAIRFPNLRTEEGRSLGTDELDYEVCARASEELARLQGAVYAAARYQENAA